MFLDYGLEYYKNSVNAAPGFSLGTHVTSLYKDQLAFVLVCDLVQRRLKISGSVAEIGIFLGDYFCMLASCANPQAGEIAVAIDLFLDQHLNVDGSGAHDKSIEWHRQHYLHRVKSGAEAFWVNADSLVLNPVELRELGVKEYRMVSIDGGHEHYHVTSDIALTARILSHGGIIIIDDYTNQGWPAVAEGVARYFLLSSFQPLSPFMIGSNKLFLTTTSFYDAIYETARSILQYGGVSFKSKKLFGSDIIVLESYIHSLVEEALSAGHLEIKDQTLP